MNRVLCPLAIVALLAATASAQDPVEARSAVYLERTARRESFRNTKVQEAVRSGIAWLKAHQDTDGHWDCSLFMNLDPETDRCTGPGTKSNSIGVSALALLAMLAQGDPAHTEACRTGADWLARQFDKHGRVLSEMHDFMYAQAMATMALTEAAAQLGGETYRNTAIAGIDYIQSHHNPGAAWRYQPHDSDNDSSITSWCISALAAGVHLGLEVKPGAVGEALAWLDTVTDGTGMCGYTNLGETSSRKPGGHLTRFPPERGAALTAAGLHARFTAGMSPNTELAKLSAAWIQLHEPAWDPQAIDFYYWLQGSIAMSQLAGTREQKSWDAALQKALVPNQRQNGASRGSWDPVGVWCEEGGRIYATAAAVIALSGPYRLGHLDALSSMPDAAPFRGVHAAWKDGKFGTAITALGKIPTDSCTAEEQVIRRRIDWYANVELTRAGRTMATLDKHYPDLLARRDALDGIVSTFAGLPIADDARRELGKVLDDPRVKTEVNAQKELHALQRAYDAAVKSSSKMQRTKMRQQLLELAQRYPDTGVARQIPAMLQHLQ